MNKAPPQVGNDNDSLSEPSDNMLDDQNQIDEAELDQIQAFLEEQPVQTQNQMKDTPKVKVDGKFQETEPKEDDESDIDEAQKAEIEEARILATLKVQAEERKQAFARQQQANQLRKIEEKKAREEEAKQQPPRQLTQAEQNRAMQNRFLQESPATMLANEIINDRNNEPSNADDDIGDAYDPDQVPATNRRHNPDDFESEEQENWTSDEYYDEQNDDDSDTERINGSSSSSSDSDSMFEYELDSQHGQNEERKQFDYDFTKEEFLNPIVVKGPDGTVSVGTESKDKNSKEALCWNCQTHLIYRMGAKKVRCFKCSEVNDMNINNKETKSIVKCDNQDCKQDLLIPDNAYRIFCPNCNTIFVSKNHKGLYHKIDVMHFFT